MEFKDESLTVDEYVKAQPDLIQSQLNTWIKLMAKKSDVSFMDIRKMDLSEFISDFTRFLEKYGLNTKFDFLGT